MSAWTECPVIRLDLDAPADQWYGSIGEDVVASGRTLLDAVLSDFGDELTYLADLVRLRTANRFHAEARAIAERVGVNWRQVMLANVSYDMAIAMFSCSTMALATPAGPVLARNMDWFPEDLLARASYRFEFSRGGKPAFATAGWPGTIGVVTGMSHRGFAVALNAVCNTEGVNKAGYPVLLHLRRVLEDARDYEHAVKMLSDTKLVASGLFTLVGTGNEQRVVIERTPTRCERRHAQDDGPLVTTNDFRKLGQDLSSGGGELYASACDRFANVTRLAGGWRGDADPADEALLTVLTDPGVMLGITAQHIIMRPGGGVMRTWVPTNLLSQ